MGYTISEEGEKSVKVIDKKIWWIRITYSNIYFLLLNLWNAGNKLPTVKREGFKRIIIIIKADNALKSHQVDET